MGHLIRMASERPTYYGMDWTFADGEESSQGRPGGQYFLKIGMKMKI